jgi:hypothetical protein
MKYVTTRPLTRRILEPISRLQNSRIPARITDVISKHFASQMPEAAGGAAGLAGADQALVLRAAD